MAIPDYQSLMLPLLQIVGDGQVHSLHDVVNGLGSRLGVSDKEQKELLPSGTDKTFYNRARWAKLYLAKACLLKVVKRGELQITARGKKVLVDNPQRIDVAYLSRFPEFLEFRRPSQGDGIGEDDSTAGDLIPQMT